ncbi:MAG: hypothetical protein B1H13_00010 [Desulfobacteraceae bacterium 4484_190.3]|nr:MAG: hypothetical protein B1H13_00010 [Desulfobacteraceae bacterium 4484_190.3]
MNNKKNQSGIILISFFLFTIFLITPSCLLATEKKSVTLLPFVLHADKSKHGFLTPALKSVFISHLAGEGLDIMDEKKFAPLLSEKDREGINDAKRAEEIARHVNAEYAIFGTVTSLGGWYNLDLAIIDLTSDEPKTTRASQSVEENKLIPTLRDVAHQFRAIIDGLDYDQQRLSSDNKQELSSQSKLPEDRTSMGLFFKPTSEGHEPVPVSETSFRMKIMSFDTGDLDGDGKTELIFLTRQKILIYHRNDKVLTLIDSYKGSGSESFFAISVGDGDKNGRDEMYVDASYGGRGRTTVFEWRGRGQFNVLFKETGHIRIVKDQGGAPPILLYQNSLPVSVHVYMGQGYDQFFKGRIYEVRYDKTGNQLEKHPVAGFGKGPGKGPQLHTLIRYDMDRDGRPEYIGLGKKYSKLTVWNPEGIVHWRGNKKMGGTNNALWEGENDLSAQARIPINAPPAIADVDDDGKPELLAIHNIAITEKLRNLLIYSSAQLYAYKIEGTNLSHQVFTTKEFEDSIAGVCSIDKTVYLAMLKGDWSTIGSKGSSRLMWFEQ